MQFTLLALTSLMGLTLAAPSPLLDARDKFQPCSTFGSNCATQDQRFCDASTGKVSVCHKFGSDCWIRYTQDACPAKREATSGLSAIEKRDKFNKCSAFGSVCNVDGNQFCDPDTGKLSTCRQVGWGTGECWIRYTQTACSAKRTPEYETGSAIMEGPVVKRDEFKKCDAFGANCAVDGNVFCQNGRKSVCHQVGFGSGECWVRYTAQTC
jgi:hypothetical protein